jgi:hypothetical protein
MIPSYNMIATSSKVLIAVLGRLQNYTKGIKIIQGWTFFYLGSPPSLPKYKMF